VANIWTGLYRNCLTRWWWAYIAEAGVVAGSTSLILTCVTSKPGRTDAPVADDTDVDARSAVETRFMAWAVVQVYNKTASIWHSCQFLLKQISQDRATKNTKIAGWNHQIPSRSRKFSRSCEKGPNTGSTGWMCRFLRYWRTKPENSLISAPKPCVTPRPRTGRTRQNFLDENYPVKTRGIWLLCG